VNETSTIPLPPVRLGSTHYSHRIVLFVDDSFQNTTVIRPATSGDACSAFTDEKA
jgi:hypothetical protein